MLWCSCSNILIYAELSSVDAAAILVYSMFVACIMLFSSVRPLWPIACGM